VCFTPCFNVQPDIFAFMNCCVVALIAVSSDILAGSADSLYAMACARDGFGVKSSLEIDISQNFITCAKGINSFRILLLVNLST